MSETIFMPEYYDKFQCLAGDCKFTCCQAWNITLTKQDYMKVKNTRKSKEMQELCSKGIRRMKKDGSDKEYATIVFDDEEKCQFLGEDGLCQLQSECGPKVLPAVCRTFPRGENKVFLIERSCSTGCEKVVQMLLEMPRGIRFKQVIEDTPKGQTRDPMSSPELKRRPILRHYHEIRLMCMGILQSRQFTLDGRMVLLGMAIQDLDQMEREEKLEEFPKWLVKYKELLLSKETAKKLKKLPSDPRYSAFNNIKTILRIRGKVGKQVRELFDQIFQNIKVTIDGDTISYQTTVLARHKKNLEKLLDGEEWFWENIIVNHVFNFHFPFQNNVGSLWAQYMLLCYEYSFMKFCTAVYLTPESGKEDLIYAVTACSRALLHGTKDTLQYILDQGRDNHDDTLSHMAMIVKG